MSHLKGPEEISWPIHLHQICAPVSFSDQIRRERESSTAVGVWIKLSIRSTGVQNTEHAASVCADLVLLCDCWHIKFNKFTVCLHWLRETLQFFITDDAIEINTDQVVHIAGCIVDLKLDRGLHELFLQTEYIRTSLEFFDVVEQTILLDIIIKRGSNLRD